MNVKNFTEHLTMDNVYRVIEWCIQFLLDICIGLIMFVAMTAVFQYWVALAVFLCVSIAQLYMRLDGTDPTLLKRGWIKRTVDNVARITGSANDKAKDTAATTVAKTKSIVAETKHRVKSAVIVLADGTPVTSTAIN